MRLTLFTDYSLRVLLYLSHKKGAPATITEMANFYAISRHHLVKVVHNLGLLGFVETMRGKGGGIKLAPGVERKSIGDIIRKTEPDLNLLECFDKRTDHCAVTNVCRLKGVLFGAASAFMAELDRHALSEVGNFSPLHATRSVVQTVNPAGIRRRKGASA